MDNVDAQDSDSAGPRRAHSDARASLRGVGKRIALVVLVLGIVAFAVTTGVARWLLIVIGILLAIDILSGLHLIAPLLLVRIFLPLVLTTVLIPFALIWPGDSGATHWSTVRARFRSIGQMWRGYWNPDRGC